MKGGCNLPNNVMQIHVKVRVKLRFLASSAGIPEVAER